LTTAHATEIGREVAMSHHLQDGEEYTVRLPTLIAHGRDLFAALWTVEEGGGRPMTKGTGTPLADGSEPLVFPRNFNRISAPDSNGCAGCHNAPYGTPGGGGDIVGNVFVLAQRFDCATFDPDDTTPTKGAVDENGDLVTLDTIANSRATLGMFGSGYYEMLARQITADLQAARDATVPGEATALTSKGISFGTLVRFPDGWWDTSTVEGLPAPSLHTTGPADPPSLVILPFHQAGAVASLRQFTNNAYNHHHGIQAEERFGVGVDADGDGFVNELTRADVTAAAIYQAVMPVPGRVIPRDPEVEAAVEVGEQLFIEIGCGSCHIPALPLDGDGHVFVEPDPYNPPGNLQPGEAPDLAVDLNDARLPGPRLSADRRTGITWVPVFTDFKLHDITYGPDDPNREPLNMHYPPGSVEFNSGNSRFLTKRLWGAANERPFFHHGKYTTLRQAVLAHYGEADASRAAFESLSDDGRDSIIEFLKTLQVLPPGVKARIVDERFHPREWPPRSRGHEG
ncbi:MAG: di-heme oxidoredictase family protein, partial [Nitrospirota bacterium]